MPEIINKKCSLKKVVFNLSIVLSFTVCANGYAQHKPRLSQGVIKSQAQPQGKEGRDGNDVVIEANPDQIRVAPNSELAIEADLPLQDVDADTLEQLLVMNFASFQQNWALATENGILAANKSKDFRVARTSTLLALRSDNYENAAIASQIWLELKPESVNAQNMNILSLVGAHEVAAAKISIEKQIGQQDIDAYIKQLAGLLVRQKNAEAAFEVADYMVQKYSESPQVLVSSAFVAQTFKKYEAAELWVDQALTLKPGWDLAAQLNVNLLGEQNKLDQRAMFIDQFVNDFPHSVAMRINHATELGRAKNYRASYSLMLEVLKDAPKHVKALAYTAALAEQLEDRKKSASFLKRALRVEPDNDEIRWSLARLALIDKKYVTAERLFDKIKDESLYVRAQIQVANMRNETQGVRAAVDTLRALQPRTEAGYREVAITRHYLLMGAHEYDEAFGYVNETLVYLPDNLELLYARALVAAELGKVDIAEQDLTKIIAQQPAHANALNALGYTLADQTERYEEAKILISKALVLRPNDAHILDSMGWVSYRLNDFETALEFLQKAYEASPEAEVAAHLGEVLWESGDTETAGAVFRKSFAEDRDNPALNKVIKRYGIQLNDKGDARALPESSSE